MKTPEDEEFERVERESGWRKRQIMAEDDDDIQDYKKPWVGLTDEEITELHHEIKVRLMGTYKTEEIYRAIEAKLKEKNNA